MLFMENLQAPSLYQILKNAVIGHDETILQLERIISKDRLPHSLIFSGMESIGKRICAEGLAKYLFAKSPNSKYDIISSQIDKGSFPDIKVLRQGNTNTEAIRDMIHFLQSSKLCYNHRVAIIDNVDKMSNNAANACLKILEEPKDNSTVIMITHNIGSLLPTIKSRSTIINFKPLDLKCFSRIMCNKFKELQEGDISRLYGFSRGSIAIACELLSKHGLEIEKSIDVLLNIGFASSNEAMDTISQYATDDGQWQCLKELLLYKLRAHILSIQNASDMRKGVKIFQEACKLLHKSDSLNLNRRYVLHSILSMALSS